MALIASPASFVTSAGYPQTAGSNDDAGPTVAQNIRQSVTSSSSTLQSGPLPNPLDKYSSYAWNAALYICKPSDYNAYATGGNDGVPGLPGYQLIARSGGSSIGPTQRNPFFSDIDLTIDKIKIDATIGV